MGRVTVSAEDQELHRLLAKAIELAAFYHGGTADKGGNPYIEHPMRVAARCKTLKGKIVAWIHDTLEDTDCTVKILREHGFPTDILHSLDCVTKRYGEEYEDFILRAYYDEIAREEVKPADIKDNMDWSRLPPNPTNADFERVKKYTKALAFLEGKITKEEYLNAA
jgi:hypothetical protein